MIPPPPRSTLFPYTTLFRSVLNHPFPSEECHHAVRTVLNGNKINECMRFVRRQTFTDRKSTRLNSSHANISYAVFCLKKKKKQTKLQKSPKLVGHDQTREIG